MVGWGERMHSLIMKDGDDVCVFNEEFISFAMITHYTRIEMFS